jgi:hypothetical protein
MWEDSSAPSKLRAMRRKSWLFHDEFLSRRCYFTGIKTIKVDCAYGLKFLVVPRYKTHPPKT